MTILPRLFIALAGFAVAGAAAADGLKSGARVVDSPLSARPASPAELKMDPGLRMAVEQARESALRGLPLRSSQRFAALLGPASPFDIRLDPDARDPALSVFMRLESEQGVEGLTALGARVLVQRDELVLARVPLSRIESVADDPAVRALSLSRRWTGVLDSSWVRTGVREVYQGAGGLPQPYQGTGVLVGVLDSGIDYTHDDFRTPANKSRLKGLFDFSQGTDGLECRIGQLDSLTCPEIDGSGSHGHGTHVTGIAAGNARKNPVYLGMAPQADLLFVKGIRDAQSNGGFTDADIVNGVAWMTDRALALGEPIAINLSLGGQLGAHDGTSIQEQFLDRFVGPGRIIVAAAGNAGLDPIHVSYAVQGTDYNSALESGLLLTGPGCAVDLWAPPATNMGVGLAAYLPSDIGTPIFVSAIATAGQLRQGTAVVNSTAIGDYAIDARTTADPNNGARNVLVQIGQSAGGIDPSQLVWSIYTTGSGTFDMWALGAIFFPSSVSAPPYFRAGNSDKTIGIPGTAKRILCVGSHVSKTQWVDIDGVTRIQPNATLDAISGFSSRGPSRDGRVLPNFTAPGEAIISALSKDFPAPRNVTAQGGGYQEQQGTSQASPHVTGIVALMLQRDPALTPENARTILQQTAAAAGGGVPNNTFGYGRVRALAALQGTPDPLDCMTTLPSGALVRCDEAAAQPLALMAFPTPTTGSLRFQFAAPSRERVHLALYDLLGRRVRTLIDGVVEAGVQTPRWDGDDERGRSLPSGVYLAKLVTPGATRSIRLVLAR